MYKQRESSQRSEFKTITTRDTLITPVTPNATINPTFTQRRIKQTTQLQEQLNTEDQRTLIKEAITPPIIDNSPDKQKQELKQGTLKDDSHRSIVTEADIKRSAVMEPISRKILIDGASNQNSIKTFNKNNSSLKTQERDVLVQDMKQIIAGSYYTNLRDVSQRAAVAPITAQRTPIYKNIKYQDNLNFYDDGVDESVKVAASFTRPVSGFTQSIKCYVSMTTTPDRFYAKIINGVDPFIDTLNSLLTQTKMPDKIIISLCNTYKRQFEEVVTPQQKHNRINDIKSISPRIEIIETDDLGPATKILGLMAYNDRYRFINSDDLIIVVDDDTVYSRDLVRFHVMGYQLYNCDIVALDQDALIRSWEPYTFNTFDTFYTDEYMGFLYGWLSFSVKYQALSGMRTFYSDIVTNFPDVFYHDDLIFTLYAHISNLYIVEARFIPLYHDTRINKSLRDLYRVDPDVLNRSVVDTRSLGNFKDARSVLDTISPLRDTPLPSGISREQLEVKVCASYGIEVENRTFVEKNTVYNIDKNIRIRDRCVELVDGVELIESPEDIHILFSYIDQNKLMITVSVFNEMLVGLKKLIVFDIFGSRYSVELDIEHSSRDPIKFSHILKIDDLTIRKRQRSENKNGYNVVQTNSSTTVTKKKYYSVSAVLNCSLEYPYVFFDDTDVTRFITGNFSPTVVEAINNLVPGAYISDIFRYCYIFINGGIYVDCKKLFYIPISEYIDRFMRETKSSSSEIFINDCDPRCAYNAILVAPKNSKTIKLVLIYSIFNIIKNRYGENPLYVTGPGCLGEVMDYVYANTYQYFYRNITPEGMSPEYSFVADTNGKKIIKNSYIGYYDENRYYDTNHYNNLWHDKKIYRTDLSEKYNSITKMSQIQLIKSQT
jgi:hypothetical protein